MDAGSAVARLRSSTVGLGRALWVEVRDDRVRGLAAEVAFFTVLAVFPGLLIAAGLIGYLDVLIGPDATERIQSQVTGALELVLADRASSAVESVGAVFEGEYGGLLTFATAGALVTLSTAWAVVIEALNLAYGTEERRSWPHRRGLGLLLAVATVVVVVLALLVVVVGPLLGQGVDIADRVGLGGTFVFFWNVLRLPVLAAVVAAWLVLVYHVAPTRRTPWRASLPGAVATTALWLLASAGFHLYLRVLGDRNPVLEAFGGGVVVLLWVYLLSIALLIGGELNAVLHDRKHRRGSDRGRAGRPA